MFNFSNKKRTRIVTSVVAILLVLVMVASLIMTSVY